jgi:hypothetical protein
MLSEYEKENKRGKSNFDEIQMRTIALIDNGRKAGCFLSELIKPSKNIRVNEAS